MTVNATDRKTVRAIQDMVWFEKMKQEVYHHLACREQAQKAIADSPYTGTREGEARLREVDVLEGVVCDCCGKLII